MGRTPNRLPNNLLKQDITDWEAICDCLVYKSGSYTIAVNENTGAEIKRSTDSATAIQAAIDELHPYGGVIYIKPVVNGLYEITNDIIIKSGHRGLTIAGGGFMWYTHGTLLKATADLDYAIIDDQHNDVGFHKFIGLAFDGNQSDHGTWNNKGIQTNCQDTLITECSFWNCYYGIQPKSNVWVDRCWLEQNSDGGVYVAGSKPRITNNIFWQSGSTDITFATNTNDIIIANNTTTGVGTDYFVYFLTGAYTQTRAAIYGNVAYNLDVAMFRLLANTMSHMVFANNVLNGNSSTANMFECDGATKTYLDILISNNVASNLTGSFFSGATTGLTIKNNIGYINENGGAAATVADGGTITHGLVTTPTYVDVTGSVAGEFISVTALAADTFTVAIKKHDGSAGTAQTVYWRAWI